MERDNFEISQELEQMREQFKVLTEKVEKQNIVNEKLMTASIESKIDRYRLGKNSWVGILILLYATYFNIDFCMTNDYPLWFVSVFGGFCILSVTLYILNLFKQKKDLDFKGDISGFSRKVKSVKRFHIITSVITRITGYSMLVTFLFYFMGNQQGATREDSFWSILIFVLIFCGIAIRKEIKNIRILNDILKEIEE